MRKLNLVLIFFLFIALKPALAGDKTSGSPDLNYSKNQWQITDQPYADKANHGFFNIIDGNLAIGLGDTKAHISKYIAGLSNVMGYRFSSRIWTGVGVGINAYNEGATVPLYLDGRLFFGKKKNKPFLVGDAGYLFRAGGVEANTRIFVNPGFGWNFPISAKASVIASLGYFAQWENETNARDSFINLKVGFALY